MDALAKLDKARLLLQETKTLSEVKKILDLAEAAMVYAEAVLKSQDAAYYAQEIKLEAKARLGEIASSSKKSPGGRPRKTPASPAGDSEYRQAIKKAGISERDAQRFQQAGKVPEKIRKEYIEDAKSEKKEISIEGLLEFTKSNGAGNVSASKKIDEAQRYRDLQSKVRSIYKDLEPNQRKEEFHKHAQQIMEDGI